eukprot:jgi/Mesvir1/123/Mv26431-RA.3
MGTYTEPTRPGPLEPCNDMSQLTLVSWNVRGLNTYGSHTPGQGQRIPRTRELANALHNLLERYVGPSHEIWIGLQEHKIQEAATRTALRAARALAPRTVHRWAWARGTQGGTALIQYRKPPNPTLTCQDWAIATDTAEARWQGRWTRQSITWAGNKGYIISVYAPTEPTDQASFYPSLFKMAADLISQGFEIALMGDFNIDLDEHPPIRTAAFSKQIMDLNLQDVIRSRDHGPTWLATRLNVRTTRRLDKIYITPAWADLVCYASVDRSVNFSDHYPLIVTLAHHTNSARGPGIPRLNKHLLADDKYYLEIMTRWQSWRASKGSYTDCCSWMQEGLANILEFSQLYSQNIRRQKGQDYRYYQRIVNKLQAKPTLYQSELTKLQRAQTELDKLRFERHTLALDSENLWWHQVGERMTKEFFALIPTPKAHSSITEIQDEHGSHRDITSILQSGHRYYSALFLNEPHPDSSAAMQKILHAIPRRLTPAQQQELDQIPSMEEATTAMEHIKTGSAPGVDGLPIEFWKTFWSLLHIDFYECILEIWRHGKVSGRWAESALILLYKKGDKTLWKNYRPIRLLTVAYKIISKIIQRRLYTVLDFLIGPEQVGFRANLHINDSITLIMDIVEKAWRDDIEGFILFWDFEKAFDRMCWEYLEHILTALGFGPQLMTVIMGMIKSLAWYLLIDGHKSATGASSRSLPQGDCMSPILFLLAHAGLYWLHQNDPRIRGFPTGNGKGIFQTAYVDDTTNVCISLPEVHAVMDNITTYSVATQQRCNVLKSTGLHIGKTNTLRYALPNLAVTWVKPGDHHLLHNCPIGCTPEGRLAEQRSFMYDETNHVGKLAGVLLTAGRWGAVHRMSLRGRTLIVNQLLFSKVLYYCQAHPPNDATTQLIQRLGSNFVWKQKGLISHTVHGWINREMSFMSWVHGGLGLHNIQWRLWSLYAKQVISVFMGVNTHPGCMLARETLASLSTHASGTSWQLGAGILGSTLISYKGLPWYWQRIWTGYNKLKPGRLVFPTTREEVARQPLFFNDLITDATNKPLGTLHGHNPYDGFLRASPPIVRVLDLYLGHGAAYRRLSYDEVSTWVSHMPSLQAWQTLISAIPAAWHALMTAPRKPIITGDWVSFYADGVTPACKGLVVTVLPPEGLQLQLLDAISGHNGCLYQLSTLYAYTPASQCHRIRVVPWSVPRSA